MHFGKTGWGTGLVAVLVAAIPLATPAHAALGDWALAPPSFAVGSAELRLNGAANGALFSPHQPGWRGAQASGAFLFMPQLRRDYDSGLSLALNGTFAAADPLSRGRYDGDVIERLSASARTGLGTLEIGISDGAGESLPPGVEGWTDERGKTRLLRVAGSLARRPWMVREVTQLGARSFLAMDAVQRALACVHAGG